MPLVISQLALGSMNPLQIVVSLDTLVLRGNHTVTSCQEGLQAEREWILCMYTHATFIPLRASYGVVMTLTLQALKKAHEVHDVRFVGSWAHTRKPRSKGDYAPEG
eukprot:15480550-Alexandrium_andersonii.AAC.1